MLARSAQQHSRNGRSDKNPKVVREGSRKKRGRGENQRVRPAIYFWGAASKLTHLIVLSVAFWGFSCIFSYYASFCIFRIYSQFGLHIVHFCYFLCLWYFAKFDQFKNFGKQRANKHLVNKAENKKNKAEQKFIVHIVHLK